MAAPIQRTRLTRANVSGSSLRAMARLVTVQSSQRISALDSGGEDNNRRTRTRAEGDKSNSIGRLSLERLKNHGRGRVGRDLEARVDVIVRNVEMGVSLRDVGETVWAVLGKER